MRTKIPTTPKACLAFSFLFFVTAAVAQEDIFGAARSNDLPAAQAFIKSDPNAADKANSSGYTPLIIACYHGNAEVAALLISISNKIDYNSGQGTALMAAVMSGNEAIVKALLAKHADTEQEDREGKTALYYAVFFNKIDIVRLLLAAGASKTHPDKQGITPRKLASLGQSTELTILLDQ